MCSRGAHLTVFPPRHPLCRYASLTALTRVTRATLHELGLCLLRLVQPRSAAAGEAQGAGVVGTLVESGIAGMVSTFSNLFGSSAQM